MQSLKKVVEMNFKIDRALYFTFNVVTSLPCPECNSGKLVWRGDSDIKDFEHKAFNKVVIRREDYDPEFLRFDFSGSLTCNNPSCGEKIAVVGEKELIYDNDYNPSVCYFPKYFARAPKIIDIRDEYPKKNRRTSS